MPLFMDLHVAADYAVRPTMEEIRRNHIADLNTQHKYGVKFLQYWINEEAGMVFCLMEAPDKESCAAVHREAHGDMPCNVIELKGGDYSVFMGDDEKVNAYDIVETGEGKLDSGYRFILVLDIITAQHRQVIFERMNRIMQLHAGRCVQGEGHRELIAFNTAQKALRCAVALKKEIQQVFPSAEVRIGLSAGLPVTHRNDFFADAIDLAHRLCDMAQNGQVIVSPLTGQLLGEIAAREFVQDASLKLLNEEEQHFLTRLLEVAGRLIQQPLFALPQLCEQMGMSRSGLYRKIIALSGRSATEFVQERRLQHAFHLLTSKMANVTQAAFEVGYTNPSYFSKTFQMRFGIAPLQLIKTSSSS